MNNNEVYDLSNDYTYMKVRIFDVMKTMDKRVPISKEIIDKYIAMYNSDINI